MAFNYLEQVEETIVAEGTEGKVIMVYGGNNLGKTSQFAKIPKNIFIPLESNGLNAIGGVAKLPIYDYATFKDFVSSMKEDKVRLEKLKSDLLRQEAKLEKMKQDKSVDKDELKEQSDKVEKTKNKIQSNPFKQFSTAYTHITLDSVTALDKKVEKYIVDMADVQELGDIGHGKLYKRLENEFYRTWSDFVSLGFTVLLTAHDDERNLGDEENPIMQKIPKGSWKRVVKPIIDECDIVIYLRSNGVDSTGTVVPSSAFLAETQSFFARTKWDNMVTKLDVYSYDNLAMAIDNAIAEQRASGMKVGSFIEQKKRLNDELALDHNELIKEIGDMVTVIYNHDGKDQYGENMVKYGETVEEVLGMDKKVSECGEKHVTHLKLILSKTRDIVKDLK